MKPCKIHEQTNKQTKKTAQIVFTARDVQCQRAARALARYHFRLKRWRCGACVSLPQLACTRGRRRKRLHERHEITQRSGSVAQPSLRRQGNGTVTKAGFVRQQRVAGAASKRKPILVAAMHRERRWGPSASNVLRASVTPVASRRVSHMSSIVAERHNPTLLNLGVVCCDKRARAVA